MMLSELSTEKKVVDWGGCSGGGGLVRGVGGAGVADCNFEHDGNAITDE